MYYFFLLNFCSRLPDRVRVWVVASNCGNYPSGFFTLSHRHLIMALRQDWTFIYVIHINRDGGCGCRSISTTYQSDGILSAEYQDVFAFTFKVQNLKKKGHIRITFILGLSKIRSS